MEYFSLNKNTKLYYCRYQSNFSYLLIIDQTGSIFIDPGFDEPTRMLLGKVPDPNRVTILVTHDHLDHTGGISFLIESLKKEPELIDPYKLNQSCDKSHTALFSIDDLHVRAIYTPGHCKDHYIYYFDQLEVLFSGDLLFAMGCGRPDTDPKAMVQLGSSLKLLNALPGTTKVFPGHDYLEKNINFAKSLGMEPVSKVKPLAFTLEEEAKHNPFLIAFSQQNSMSEFINLRTLRNQF